MHIWRQTLNHIICGTIVRDIVDPTPPVIDELKVGLKLRDNIWRNALHWAADCVADKNESNIMADVMDLIAAGELTSCRHDSGVTPLQIAIRRGRPQVARYLMDPRSISTINNEGRTPLYDAVCAGLPCIVEELLTMYQVNPNVMFDGWDTPLHCIYASVSFRKDKKGRLQIYRLNSVAVETALIDTGHKRTLILSDYL
uniref:ANK_REP_REGION domain-containing protein n=1 Tax=Panagrellus redivivus TaxID=6233 RepID=A0A7E4WC55_PANRE